MSQAKTMVAAARRLIVAKADAFTTEELAREAGVALQTFYRYFSSKDELLLAVISDVISEASRDWKSAAQELPDSVARLRYYITSALGTLERSGSDIGTARFIVSAHWRLHRVFPDELAEVERPFVDLLLAEIRAAQDAGKLKSADAESAAWLLSELVRSVYYFYAYGSRQADSMESMKEKLWDFSLAALGGRPTVAD